jgi:hypothetical protein
MAAWIIATLIVPLLVVGTKTFARCLWGWNGQTFGQMSPHDLFVSVLADRDLLVYSITVLVGSCALCTTMASWIFLLYLVILVPAVLVYGYWVSRPNQSLDEPTRTVVAWFISFHLTASWISAILTAAII